MQAVVSVSALAQQMLRPVRDALSWEQVPCHVPPPWVRFHRLQTQPARLSVVPSYAGAVSRNDSEASQFEVVGYFGTLTWSATSRRSAHSPLPVSVVTFAIA